ncbi:SUF system NifU family Fe-S cluster assembly protein [Psychromonas sp. MB-3u-54]|uniref:Fe-S cluster assembly sulfur transfer protein SufU n=1 Tax=Psychromonas sp. MB-3u-54 TaxID=2058319 RepID=UPI000C33BBD7|nr:SUF system NifU family Fe-S cluster assembly protein [Psychromonas sp. MB-3u-54]PKH02664.1 SUF system NifU family Fe-S cluster assembly protein [Psychromonas sp. MB-3u-54]
MNDELRALYQEVIIDHGRHPRNFKKLDHPSYTQEGYNPLCGDRLTLYLRIADNKIIDASFEGQGCAISMAASSLMTERIKNMPVTEARQLFDAFQNLVTQPDPPKKIREYLGKLTVLGGVRDFPVRIKCATLPWHALNACLNNITKQIVSTE